MSGEEARKNGLMKLMEENIVGRPKGIPSKLRLDLSGITYNRLTGRCFSHVDKHQGSVWLFDCSCGNTHEALAYLVKCGKTKSCGCWDSEVIIARNKAMAINPFKTRVVNGKETHARPKGVSKVEHLSWLLVKKRAKTYDREFALLIEDYLAIVKQNCHYCGCEPYHYTKKEDSVFVHNGIDRKDNNQGYTLDNVVPCCGECNRIKRQRSYDEFIHR